MSCSTQTRDYLFGWKMQKDGEASEQLHVLPPLFNKVETEFTKVNCARLRDLAEHFSVWLKRGVKRVALRFHMVAER